jgi:hypothetical protein
MQPGSLASAVALVEREGWAGLQIDNENYPGQASWDDRLPQRFDALLGNLSAAFEAAGMQVVVDICSTWTRDIGELQRVRTYAKHARPNTIFMDMAMYTQAGHIPGGNMQQLTNLKAAVPLGQIAVGVGLVEMPGHRNASCGGWPQCTNFSNPACGCYDYGWTEDGFRTFTSQAAMAGVTQIDVWRQDMTPPPGTSAAIPPWFIDALAKFLKG